MSSHIEYVNKLIRHDLNMRIGADSDIYTNYKKNIVSAFIDSAHFKLHMMH